MQVIAVVGLGYVGLPLAVEFGKKFRTIGLDVSTEKVDAYRRHVDPTGEITTDQLAAASLLEPTTDATSCGPPTSSLWRYPPRSTMPINPISVH